MMILKDDVRCFNENGDHIIPIWMIEYYAGLTPPDPLAKTIVEAEETVRSLCNDLWLRRIPAFLSERGKRHTYAFAAAWEQERPMTKRSEIERDDAKYLFDQIIESTDHRGCDTECPMRANTERLAASFDALLDKAFEAGVIAGRAEAGKQVFK